MFGRIIYSDQIVTINGQELLGVTQSDLSISTSLSPIFIAGAGFHSSVIESEPEQSLSFSTYLSLSTPDVITGLFNRYITGETLYKKTADALFEGARIYDSLISSYTIDAKVGAIPSVEVNLEGNSIWEAVENRNQSRNNGSFTILRPGDMVLDLGPSLENQRVQSVRYSIPVSYKRRKGIGKFMQASAIEPIYPIVSQLQVSFEVDSYVVPSDSDIICNQLVGDTLLFSSVRCGTNGRKFRMEKAKIKSLSHGMGIGGAMTFNIDYEAIINDIGDIGRLLST
jgi:hypothetical protein